jgi:adenosylcobinamide-phosphate synthase
MLFDWSLPTLALLMAAGLALDGLLGEARRWHPLVGFGRLANAVERRFNRGGLRYGKGGLAWMLVVLPPVSIAYQLTNADGWPGMAGHALLLYFSLGLRSLYDHTQPIARAIADRELNKARALTARIVTRDTARADAGELAKATVESLLENGNDAVFGTLFWFIVGGGPGALLFRLANTLDAMWGYRTPRYLAFGCAAARIDDLLNWIPARLTALSYALLGETRNAWQCWRTQAPGWPSPNAGPVMASGAGALGLALGGTACYDGVTELRPILGRGRAAHATDIGRAWRLVAGTALLWLTLLAVAAGVERMLHA